MVTVKRIMGIFAMLAVAASVLLVGSAVAGPAADEAQPQEVVPLQAGAPLLISATRGGSKTRLRATPSPMATI